MIHIERRIGFRAESDPLFLFAPQCCAIDVIGAARKDYYDRGGIEYGKGLFPDCESCGHCCTVE